jgi:F-type H+-transporting ATPase subunit alpha
MKDKAVAGGLRLGLASYRALAAFAQFGSDLDKATQQELTRGERLVEILKQPQYQPLTVEEQIAVIFAATSGGLDDFPAKRVQEFEKVFRRYMADTHPEVGEEIRTTKKLSDASKATLKKAIDAVKAQLAPPAAKTTTSTPKAAPAPSAKPGKH